VRPAVLLSFLFLTGFAAADTIDDVVAKDMKRFAIPGACIGIVKDGKLIRESAYGIADIELNAPMAADDLFEIGSMTKQFTAALTLLLVEEGKIGLDDPISKFIQEAPATWSKVTVRHMLNQNSGLPEYALIHGIGLMDDFDRAKWMTTVTALPLDFEPGSAWAYSNSNYALLGWAIEKATGKAYAEVLNDRILRPLELTNTRFEDVNAVIPRRSHGYLPQGQAMLRVEGSKGIIQSDGTLMTNVADLAKWDKALGEHRLLSAESYRLLWSGGKLNSGREYPYGMGWFLSPPGAAPLVYHPGASVGYGACITRYTDAKLTVIVLTNVYGGSPEPMARHIGEAYDASLSPTIPAEAKDPNEGRTKQVRSILDELGAGKADPMTMDAEFLAPLSGSRARAFPQFLDLAKIDSLAYAGEVKTGADSMLMYRLKNPTRKLTAYVLWTKDEKLARLTLRPDPL